MMMWYIAAAAQCGEIVLVSMHIQTALFVIEANIHTLSIIIDSVSFKLTET
jgi:alkylhydroperoxidase/carboxymuconolactone decarboxylase family protein YurZ